MLRRPAQRSAGVPDGNKVVQPTTDNTFGYECREIMISATTENALSPNVVRRDHAALILLLNHWKRSWMAFP